jgi:hypothetical protein
MGPGMEGPHLFEVTVKSNDKQEPLTVLTVRADFR